MQNQLSDRFEPTETKEKWKIWIEKTIGESRKLLQYMQTRLKRNCDKILHRDTE